MWSIKSTVRVKHTQHLHSLIRRSHTYARVLHETPPTSPTLSSISHIAHTPSFSLFSDAVCTRLSSVHPDNIWYFLNVQIFPLQPLFFFSPLHQAGIVRGVEGELYDVLGASEEAGDVGGVNPAPRRLQLSPGEVGQAAGV